MYMLADGNFLTKLVCDNTDCLSFIISLLDILTILYLAYCASFRVNKGVRIFGWIWAAVVIAGTVAVVALHTCMFTLISALFSALALMALFGVTFEAIVKEKEDAKAKAEAKERENNKEDKEEKPAPAPTIVCPMAAWSCGGAAPAPAPAPQEPEHEPEEELSLRESLAMAAAVEKAPAVINKKYIADFLKDTFGKAAEVHTRGNYTKTGLPLADTHYALGEDSRKCFIYVYETDAAVVLLLRITDQYAASVRKSGHRIAKSAFPKSKDTWYSLVIDDSYTENDIQEILTDAYNMAK